MLPSKLQRGDRAPGFRLSDGQGKEFAYPNRTNSSMVLVFFRGNW